MIKGFIETSFIDWDGKVVSTLFLPRCNFRCPFCHNAGLVESPQNYETIPLSRIENFLQEHRDFIDGICLTGGEPCLHVNAGLFEFLQRIKQLGFAIKLDTNGADPNCLKKIIDQRLVDYLAMDIKAPLDERYEKLAGVKIDLNKIKQSIELIRACGLPYEFRTTVVPTLLDNQDVAEIAEYLSGAKKFVLQQFVAENAWDDSLRGLKPYLKEEFDELIQVARKFIPQTLARGV
ncbi:MAG: anaerobic ribonucleoside-triphosphate reductase activating protein [Candidatus Margulisbacteria bacterium]|nr:anaerobic ribonucleoside-triphosphate reductase activating protein [Candidatus Margulisiibacteriota bacterium]